MEAPIALEYIYGKSFINALKNEVAGIQITRFERFNIFENENR